MSYTIIYDLQFVRTSRGVTPIVLGGPSNVTTGYGKHEHRVRSWDIWSSDMLDVSDKELIGSIERKVEGYAADYQLYKRGGKWITPEKLIKTFRRGCNNAASIEDIHQADSTGFMACSVKHYKDESLSTAVHLAQDVKTTAEFESWIDAARLKFAELKEQGLDPWFSIRFYSGEKPLRKAAATSGPVIVKKGTKRYVCKAAESSVSLTANPEQAMVFENYAAAKNAIHPMFFQEMRVVSAKVLDNQKKLTVALVSKDGFYIAGLTARRLRYTRNYGDAKKFTSSESALAWFEQHRIAERFPVFANVRPMSEKE